MAKVQEELRELDAARSGAARQAGDAGRQRLEEEVGDVLFSLVNLARTLKINPEEALRKADNRFAARFQHMERMAKTDGRTLAEMTLPEKDLLWEQAKAAEREGL